MSELDNRNKLRKRMLKGGTIAFNNRCSTLPCTVRDLSDTGARLRMSHGQMVPDRFELIVELDGLVAPCVIVWRSGDEIGVSFEEAPTRTTPRRSQVVDAIVPQGTPTLRKKRAR